MTDALGILLTDSLRYAFTDEVAAAFLGAIADEMADSGLAISCSRRRSCSERSRPTTCRWMVR